MPTEIDKLASAARPWRHHLIGAASAALEGAARDLVRSVQDARKRAGLAISDRIALYLASDSEGELLAQTLAAYGDYLRGETLATSLTVGAAPEGAYSERVELGDGEVMVGVDRVTR